MLPPLVPAVIITACIGVKIYNRIKKKKSCFI